jgi:hypothetical protein
MQCKFLEKYVPYAAINLHYTVHITKITLYKNKDFNFLYLHSCISIVLEDNNNLNIWYILESTRSVDLKFIHNIKFISHSYDIHTNFI